MKTMEVRKGTSIEQVVQEMVDWAKTSKDICEAHFNGIYLNASRFDNVDSLIRYYQKLIKELHEAISYSRL